MQTRIALSRPDSDEFDPAAEGYVARIDAVTDAGRQFEAQRDRLVIFAYCLGAEFFETMSEEEGVGDLCCSVAAAWMNDVCMWK